MTKFKEFIGKHNDVPDSKFNPKELEMGIKVELEHTNDKSIAKKIAKDHLSEIPNYYTLLKKMEKSGKKKLNEANEEITKEVKYFVDKVPDRYGNKYIKAELLVKDDDEKIFDTTFIFKNFSKQINFDGVASRIHRGGEWNEFFVKFYKENASFINNIFKKIRKLGDNKEMSIGSDYILPLKEAVAAANKINEVSEEEPETFQELKEIVDRDIKFFNERYGVGNKNSSDQNWIDTIFANDTLNPMTIRIKFMIRDNNPISKKFVTRKTPTEESMKNPIKFYDEFFGNFWIAKDVILDLIRRGYNYAGVSDMWNDRIYFSDKPNNSRYIKTIKFFKLKEKLK